MKIKLIETNKLKPDPNQPRKTFDEEKIKELAETYKQHTVIVPLEINEKNIIILGERRWRAAKIAGIKELPCIIKFGLNAMQILERQLCEETMKEKIPYEEKVKALEKLAQLQGKEKITDISARIINPVTALDAELFRTAPEEMKTAVKKKKVSARTVIEARRIKNSKKEKEIVERAIKNKLGHRQVREEVKFYKKLEETKAKQIKPIKIPKDYVNEVGKLMDKLKELLNPNAVFLLGKAQKSLLLMKIEEDFFPQIKIFHKNLKASLEEL